MKIHYYTYQEVYEKQRLELVNVAKQVSCLRSIVLNPGVHQGSVPLYDKELKEVLDKLKEFEQKIKDKALYS